MGTGEKWGHSLLPVNRAARVHLRVPIFVEVGHASELSSEMREWSCMAALVEIATSL